MSERHELVRVTIDIPADTLADAEQVAPDDLDTPDDAALAEWLVEQGAVWSAFVYNALLARRDPDSPLIAREWFARQLDMLGLEVKREAA